MWESTTGGRLFSRTSFTDAIDKIIGKPVPKPSELVPSYPAELEEIVLSALERDPNRRIPTAMALAERLGEFIYSTGKLTGALQLSGFLAEYLSPETSETKVATVASTPISKRSQGPSLSPSSRPLETSSRDELDQPLRGQGFDPTVSIEAPGHHRPPSQMHGSERSLPPVSPTLEFDVDQATKPFIPTPDSPYYEAPPPEPRARALSLPLVLMILFVGLGVLSLIGAVTYQLLQPRESPPPPRPHIESLVGVTSLENGSSSGQDDGQDDGQIPADEPPASDDSPPSQVDSVPLAESEGPTSDASASPEEDSEDDDFVFRHRRRRPPTRPRSQEGENGQGPNETDDSELNIQSGSLNLLAVPQSDVYWRGRRIGRTPLFEYSLPAGQHALELRALDGESRHTIHLAIIAGSTTRRTVRY